MPHLNFCKHPRLSAFVSVSVVSAAVAACSSSPVAPKHPTTTALKTAHAGDSTPLPESLLDHALERYSRRILLAPRTRVFTVLPENVPPPSDALRDDEGDPNIAVEPLETVVVEPNGYPRVVADLPSGVRLLLYVNPEDAIPTVSSPSLLRLNLTRRNAEDDEPEPGAIAYPGLHLRILEQLDTQVHVEWRDGKIRTEGWLPRSEITKVYRPVTVPDIPQKAIELKGGVSIYAGVRGEVIAQTLGNIPLAAEVVEAPKSGHVKVIARHERITNLFEHRMDYEVRGYVLESSLGGPIGGTATGASMPGQSGGGDRASLEKGTRFYDKPNGNIVGVAADRTFAAFGTEKAPGFQSVLLETPWSLVTVWINR